MALQPAAISATWKLFILSTLFFCAGAQAAQAVANEATKDAAVAEAKPAPVQSVQELKVAAPANVAPAEVAVHQLDGAQQSEKFVVISERTLMEMQAAEAKERKLNDIKDVPRPDELAKAKASATEQTAAAHSAVHVEESGFKQKIFHNNMDSEIPESFKTGFYFFLALSTTAVIFIVVKVYRLRLSRAERKYGVQGDRTTQELTPLPISIEDGNSDDDDQTLFEIDRQQIRIF